VKSAIMARRLGNMNSWTGLDAVSHWADTTVSNWADTAITRGEKLRMQTFEQDVGPKMQRSEQTSRVGVRGGAIRERWVGMRLQDIVTLC